MKRLRGVIFDYGNTLIRLDPKFRSRRTDYGDVVARPGAERLAAFLAKSGELGAGTDRQAFVERFLGVREQNRARAEATGREVTAVESLAEALRELGVEISERGVLERGISVYFGPEVEALVPMPGAQETLDTLRLRGVKLAVLSNATSGTYVSGVAERFGWLDYFDPFVVSADIGVRKPWPEAFRAVLDRWPLSPDEVAMVGDSLYHDVKGASELGLVTVRFTAIPNPYDPPYEATVRPTFSVATHDELRRALLPRCV